MQKEPTKKILFLYTELAGYFLACVKKLHELYPVEIHIVRYPVNKEAPFDFRFSDSITVYDIHHFSDSQLLQLAEKIQPDAIYCSGWVNKSYLAVCRKFSGRIPTLVGFDNHWKGNFRQLLASLFSSFTIRNYFSHCWIPGAPQQVFAQKLGFKPDHVLTGLYCADTELFASYDEIHREAKKERKTRRFIFMGRYYDFKGVETLWEAYRALGREHGWELWCLGTGDVTPAEYPGISHFGFVQPDQMSSFIRDTDVFILPSLKEPWGVVVHEFAAAGFPLICSDQVGAASLFLEEGKNGFSFRAGNAEDLKKAMLRFTGMSSSELESMREESRRKAMQLTPSAWANRLMKVI